MTGLGPNLRRLPSGDPKPVPGTSAGGADGKPEGSSDAGDSVDGQTTGVFTCFTIQTDLHACARTGRVNVIICDL